MTLAADPHARALAINLDGSIYGSFAEIGAGQEVARWFFHVGGAAGTVARTICAYDMAMSDALYGKGERYVSRARLDAMLDREHALVVEQLGPTRGDTSRFFAFADTISARNYAGTNECHGWIGLRFQPAPHAPTSDVRLHVNLRDPSNLLQQQAVGILGVNLLYAAYHARGSAAEFLGLLFDDLSLSRIEVDAIDLRGEAFARFDATDTALRLVSQGLSHAVVFGADGAVTTASDLLRKRPLVVERGTACSDPARHASVLASAARTLKGELAAGAREPLAFFEVSSRAPDGSPAADASVCRERIARFTALGFPVVASSFARPHELLEFARRYTPEPVRFAFDAASLVELLLSYARPEGAGDGLEALGRVLSEGARLCVYPATAAEFRARLERAGVDPSSIGHEPGGLVHPDRLRLPQPVAPLYEYLRAAGWIALLDEPSERSDARAESVARAERT